MADKISASQFTPASRANSTPPGSLSVPVRARARIVIDHVRIAASRGHRYEMPVVDRFPRRRPPASSLRLTLAKMEGRSRNGAVRQRASRR